MANRLKLFFRVFYQIPRMLLNVVPEANLIEYQGLDTVLDKYGEQARFDVFAKQARIREITLSQLFGPAVEKIEAPYGTINEHTGKANQADLFYVNVIARYLKAKRIFEFGTYTGRTTYYLTYASPKTKVFTLYLPPEGARTIAEIGTYFSGSDREQHIQQIFCDSRQFDPAPYKKSMDFIFVDGGHSYDVVKCDTQNAFEMLTPGGVILWHDYGPSSDLVLVQFFVEFSREKPLFRIKKTPLLVYVDGVDPMTFRPLDGS